MLFGGAPRRAARLCPAAGQRLRATRPIRPTARSTRRPAARPQVSHGGGRGVAYCVRLCDGRYFPIQRHANANPVQLCSAFCPAAKTQVFNGSQIDHAYAGNGARYADLDNAFVYREKIVDGCTCNGKDSFGLARIDIACRSDLAAGRHRGDRRQRQGGADRDGGQQGTARGRDRTAGAARHAPRRAAGRRDAGLAAACRGAGARPPTKRCRKTDSSTESA